MISDIPKWHSKVALVTRPLSIPPLMDEDVNPDDFRQQSPVDEREEDFLFAPSQPSLSYRRTVGTVGVWVDFLVHVQSCFVTVHIHLFMSVQSSLFHDHY